MIRPNRLRNFLFVATLITLSLRAVTPDGYMPGSAGSGLLFELCPDGMPAAVMAVLGGTAGHHHHHHGNSGDDAAVSGTEQCPIGHMLAVAIAVDVEVAAQIEPDVKSVVGVRLPTIRRRQAAAYRSRAPPA